MFSRVLIIRTTSLSDCTETLGRGPVSHLEAESFDRENAFGILQQQHVHYHRNIHTRNAYRSIPRVKTKGISAAQHN
jgi:hypothetical protein